MGNEKPKMSKGILFVAVLNGTSDAVLPIGKNFRGVQKSYL